MHGDLNQDIGYFEGQQPYQPPPQQPYYPPPQQGYGPPQGYYGPQPGYGPPQGPPVGPYAPPARPETVKPLVGGILLIIVAIEAFVYGGILATGASMLGSMSDIPGMGGLSTILLVCGIIFIVLGILVVLGGISAITRKSWPLALIGSIIGIFTIGFYFTGSLLSIIALILIAISKDEF